MIQKTTISFHDTGDRGDLAVFDLPGPEWRGVRTCPFEPRRIFWITNMQQLARRGGHAHRKGEQFLFCPTGGVQIAYQCPEGKGLVVLKGSSVGAYVPPLHWLDIRNLHTKTVLVVLASNPYDDADYIRDPEEFKRLCK